MGFTHRLVALILPFLFIFFLSTFHMLTLKTIQARNFELGMHMDNKLLYREIKNWARYLYSSFHLSSFLSLQGGFVSQ